MKLGISIRASMWYIICSIVQKACAMILVPLYIRIMSTEEYGIYTIFLSWEGIVLVFTTLNVAAYVFNNCLIQNENDKDRVTSSLLGLIYLITFCWCIVLWFVPQTAEYIFGMKSIYILLVILDSLFVVIIDLWMVRCKFDFKYKSVVIVTVISSILKLFVGVICVYYSVDKAFMAIVSYVIVQGFIAVFLSCIIFKRSMNIYVYKYWKYVLLFNIPLIPHFLSIRILEQSNRLIINHYCGISDVAIYGFASKISEAMLIFNVAILSTLIPWTYKKLKKEKFSDISSKVFVTILFIACLNLILELLAPEVIKILGTEEYREAVYIISPIAMSVYFIYLFNIFANISYFYEENKKIMLCSIISSVFNIILGLYLIPKYGYLIAGYTTLTSYILLAILHMFLYKYICIRKNISNNIYDLRKINIISIIFIICSILINFLYDENSIRYIILGMIIILLINKKKYILRFLNNK